MNSLIFNPNAAFIEEWKNVYLSQSEITKFQLIIDRTCSYLTAIYTNTKIRDLTYASQYALASSTSLPVLRIPSLLKRKHSMRIKGESICEEGRLEKKIEKIEELKQRFKSDFKQSIIPRYDRPRLGYKAFRESENVLGQATDPHKTRNKIQICELHLIELKNLSLEMYDTFIERENTLLADFLQLKITEIEEKFNIVVSYFRHPLINENIEELNSQIRIVFDNLYIEAQYLKILIHKNLMVLEEHTYNDFSGDDPDVHEIRNKSVNYLKSYQDKIEVLKGQIRELYFHHYSKKKSKLILKNPSRLEGIMKEQIAVHGDEFKDLTNQVSWIYGFISAILLFALIAIIVFRQINIQDLENQVDYKIEFQIWRGASYIIIFNWVCAVVFFLLHRWGVNYKLVLLEENHIVGKYQSFFRSACLLTAIYLVLFLIYLLKQLHYINGYDHLVNLGYYMWIVNVIFMLNPFKILNSESRAYFLNLLKQMLISPFCPMNSRILFFTLMIGSFAQPFNDFSFTICSLRNESQASCQWQAKVITFVYLLCYFSIRVVQSFRLHHQFGQGKCFSKARMRFVAVLFSILTIIASFLYALKTTSQMLTFWLVTGSLATLARCHSQIRADWGLISLEEDNCLLRKHRSFRNAAYFAVMVLDPILDIAWMLTISNNVEAFFHINVLYFFMLVTFIEFVRRGIWMIFRVQDDHSQNVGNLKAMADDAHIFEKIDKILGEKKNESLNNLHQPINVNQIKASLNKSQSPKKRQMFQFDAFSSDIPEVTLDSLKKMVVFKQCYLPKINVLLNELEKYMLFVSKTYQKLTENEDLV